MCLAIFVLEKRVDVICNLLGFCSFPFTALLIIYNTQACHAIGVLRVGLCARAIVAVPAHAVSANAHHKNLVSLAVGNNCRVAESCEPCLCGFLAKAVGNLYRRGP